jgi:hypothetical protein
MSLRHTSRRRRLIPLALALCLVALAVQSGCSFSQADKPSASPSPTLKPWETPKEELQAFIEAQRPRMEAEAAGYKAATAGFDALTAGDLEAAASGLRRGGELFAESARLMSAMSPPQEFSDLTRVARLQVPYAHALTELGEYADRLANRDRITTAQAARGNALIAAFNRALLPWDLASNDYGMQMHIALQDRHLTQPAWMTHLTEGMQQKIHARGATSTSSSSPSP